MKQTKKNIKSNKKRITKKYNYRKNKRGGLNFFSRNPNIKTDIDKIQRGFENIKISFPFKDMHMDLSLPDKNINQSIAEWAKESCFDPLKSHLQNTIMSLIRTTPTPEAEAAINVQILTYIQTQTATPLNFSVIPDVITFITNPYDISVIKKKNIYSLIEKNNFVDGILQPKQEVTAEQEITLPKEVVVLVKVMQQLTREIDTNIIYINGTKQPKFPIDETEIDVPAGEFLYNTACKGYGQLLNNIRRMYRGTTVLDWNIVNTQILTCFLLDSPFYNYFINFVQNFLNLNIHPNSNNSFYYAKAKRDGGGSLIPKVSIDNYIRTYKDKYIDSKFFNLDPITENPEDGNFLQYVKNDNTCLIKINTNIIIETVQIYYVYLTGEITAVPKKIDDENYDGLIIAAIVEKKNTDIIGGVIHYSCQFRWLITKNTIKNLLNNNINFSENILNDMKTVIMSGDNRFVKWVKGSYRNKDATASDEGISESGSSITDPNQQQVNLVENFYDEKGALTRLDTIDWPTTTSINKKRYNEVGGKTRKKILKRNPK
jgi:hypothetical protein